MACDFQITVDCARPHELADWWAETLGWTYEQQDEGFIRKMIAEGYATDAATITHRGRLVWSEGAAIRPPDGPVTGRGSGQRILFQQVPEAKTVKNRLHLDIRVGQDAVPAKAAELISRGAAKLHDGQQGPQHHWITMADPEGNEFCIT
jgi:hypothetical protein